MLHTFKPIYLIEVHRRLRPCFHKTLRRLPRSLERPSNLQIFLQTWKGLRRNHHPRRQQRQQRALLLHLRMPQENEKERQQVSDGWETWGGGGGSGWKPTGRKKKENFHLLPPNASLASRPTAAYMPIIPSTTCSSLGKYCL